MNYFPIENHQKMFGSWVPGSARNCWEGAWGHPEQAKGNGGKSNGGDAVYGKERIGTEGGQRIREQWNGEVKGNGGKEERSLAIVTKVDTDMAQ